MSKNKVLSATLLAVLASTSAFAASAADDSGFYAGAGVGQSFVDERGYDDEDTAFSVFGGYQFNRYFALEGAYTDFGKIEPEAAGSELEADTVSLTAVGTVPITDKFSAYAKAGFSRWNLDTELPALTNTADDSGTDPTYGLGVQYKINDAVSLRGEYNRFEVEDIDLDVAQLQVRYSF
jgi:OOP family OmpA-OmpF porin